MFMLASYMANPKELKGRHSTPEEVGESVFWRLVSGVTADISHGSVLCLPLVKFCATVSSHKQLFSLQRQKRERETLTDTGRDRA